MSERKEGTKTVPWWQSANTTKVPFSNTAPLGHYLKKKIENSAVFEKWARFCPKKANILAISRAELDIVE